MNLVIALLRAGAELATRGPCGMTAECGAIGLLDPAYSRGIRGGMGVNPLELPQNPNEFYHAKAMRDLLRDVRLAGGSWRSYVFSTAGGLHRLRYLCQHDRARIGPDTPAPLFFTSEVPKAALTRILAYSYFTRTSTSRLRTNPSKRPERDTGYWRTYLPKIGLPVPGTLADVWPGDPRNLPGWGFDPEADEDDPRNMLA